MRFFIGFNAYNPLDQKLKIKNRCPLDDVVIVIVIVIVLFNSSNISSVVESPQSEVPAKKTGAPPTFPSNNRSFSCHVHGSLHVRHHRSFAHNKKAIVFSVTRYCVARI